MTERRADDSIDAQPSTDGEDITDQTVALPLEQPDSVTSPAKSCAGLSNPFEQHSFTDDGYVSDGTRAPSFSGQLGKS